MKKVIIPLIVVLLVAGGLFFFFKNKETSDKVARQSSQVKYNELPNISLTTTKGEKINARSLQGKLVLILFQPDCDHCQREATQIREHLDAFQSYTLYFISSAPLTEIDQFAQDYQLKDNKNIFFTYSDEENIIKNFGAVSTPSLYIFSNKRKLMKTFNGETPIEEILRYI